MYSRCDFVFKNEIIALMLYLFGNTLFISIYMTLKFSNIICITLNLSSEHYTIMDFLPIEHGAIFTGFKNIDRGDSKYHTMFNG